MSEFCEVKYTRSKPFTGSTIWIKFSLHTYIFSSFLFSTHIRIIDMYNSAVFLTYTVNKILLTESGDLKHSILCSDKKHLPRQ